jgi:hypothetical protein
MLSYEALHPAIKTNCCWVPAFCHYHLFVSHLVLAFGVRWLGGFFAKLDLVWACAVLQMCRQMHWLF